MIKIKRVKVSKEPVYDISVKDVHRFQANGIEVHNCQEIMLPTAPYLNSGDLYKTGDDIQGEVAMCSLASIVSANIESDEEYADVAYHCLVMIHTAIHEADYELPNIGYTAKARNSAGVGIAGLAHHLAKNKIVYNSEEGYKAMHEIAETHYWHLLNASLRMAKEYGNAKWIDRTKWVDGWLPIDTYNKNVDTIADFENKRDWEGLRSKIIANGGIHNSVLVAHPPQESCLEKDTKVRLADGSLMSMQEIFETTGLDLESEAYSVDIHNDDRWYELPEPIMMETVYGPRECNRVWLNGVSNYIELDMEDGTTLQLTHHHKLLVNTPDGKSVWKMAMNIEEGDDVVSVAE